MCAISMKGETVGQEDYSDNENKDQTGRGQEWRVLGSIHAGACSTNW